MSTSDGRKNGVIIALAIALSASVVAGGYMFLSSKNGANEDSPDVSIIEVEPTGEKKSDADASFEYSDSVTLNVDDGSIALNFTNPYRSKKDVSLEIVVDVDGEIISLAKVEKLSPGQKVVSAKYNSPRAIDKGNYEGKFILHFYDESGKEEIVNSEIKVKVHVK